MRSHQPNKMSWNKPKKRKNSQNQPTKLRNSLRTLIINNSFLEHSLLIIVIKTKILTWLEQVIKQVMKKEGKNTWERMKYFVSILRYVYTFTSNGCLYYINILFIYMPLLKFSSTYYGIILTLTMCTCYGNRIWTLIVSI